MFLRGLMLPVLICWLSANSQTPEQTNIQIKVLNAKTGKGVGNQTVGVAVKGVRSQAQYRTNADGTVDIGVDASAQIYVRTDWWITCRRFDPTAVQFVSVKSILNEGFVDDNICGHARSEPLRGNITIFARKPTLREFLAR